MNEKTIPDPRDSLMAALSAVEHVIAALPVAPPVLTLNQFGTAYTVELYFMGGPEGVAAFAAAYGVEVEERDTAKGAPLVQAHVTASGHEVRAWWLGTVPALVGLPAEWSAAVAS